MWFLRGKPTSITVRGLIISSEFGYQQNSYRFKVDAEEDTTVDGKLWIAIAFPWAPHKDNGSFQFFDSKLLNLLEENNDIKYLTNDDIKICENLRKLKISTTIDLINVQELIQWYLDDIGVATLWISPKQWYQIDYRHKIASDSCLFFPSRLPTIVSNLDPVMDYKLWVINGLSFSLPQHIVELKALSLGKENEKNFSEFDSIDLYTFKKDYKWDDDTRIHTENWESSDDDNDESD
jgi:hypothetical protein